MSAGPRRRHNAVLAPLVRWLWWSPAHLFAAVAGATVALVVLATLLRGGTDKPPPPHDAAASLAPAMTATPDRPTTATPLSIETTPAATTPPTTTARGPATSTVVLPAAAANQGTARAGALTWTRLWARPTVPVKTWLADLSPRTFRDFIPQVATINPANVPAHAVTGPPRPVKFARGAGQFRIPVAGSVSAIDVTVIWYPTTSAGTWVVSAFTPVS